MNVPHENVLRLIREALADQGRQLGEHECERMRRFLSQLDAATGPDGSPQRVKQVIAAFSEGQIPLANVPVSVACAVAR